MIVAGILLVMVYVIALSLCRAAAAGDRQEVVDWDAEEWLDASMWEDAQSEHRKERA